MSEKNNWYDKNYKKLLLFPAILLVLSVIYLINFNIQTGDIVKKDVSLTGGTTVTVFEEAITPEEVKSSIIEQFPDVIVRSISDIRTGSQQAIIVETAAEIKEVTGALEQFFGYELTQDNSSIEFTGASLSQGFYKQLRLAISLAFIFMAIVVFIIFRSPAPSIAVIVAAFADITLTITTVNLFGMTVSSAGIVALLMLIGYSVDTDILLTTRVLRSREGSVNERIFGALKTGLTMTFTSIVAVTIALLITRSFSTTLSQIFTILLIGLFFDLIFTWFANASILKWYTEVKDIK